MITVNRDTIYSFDQRWFFKNVEQILEEHKSKPTSTCGPANKTNRPLGKSACRPQTLYIYLSVDVKPCPRVSTWALTLFFLLSPPHIICLLSPFLRSLRALESFLCGYVAEKPFSSCLLSLSLVARSPKNDLLSFRLSAACSPSITTHPLTRMRNCGKIALWIFLSGNVLTYVVFLCCLCVYERSSEGALMFVRCF